jgi:hypothetical protein
MPKSVLSFHHPLFRKDTPDLSKEMNMAPCVSSGATANGSKKKAKEAPPEEQDAQPTGPPAVEYRPVAATSGPVAIATSVTPIATTSAAINDLAPAPTNTAVSLQDIYSGIFMGRLRTHMAAETAAKELLLQQALQAASQQQQEQQQALDAATLLAQALAQSNAGNSSYYRNPISVLPAATTNTNSNALLQGLLSTLVGTSQLQVAPTQQQLQIQMQHPPQRHLQVPPQQMQMQQLRLPQPNNTAVLAPSQIASLASALTAGGLQFGSAAPVPQQQPSQAGIGQLLSPQQQLALLSQVSSSFNATNLI